MSGLETKSIQLEATLGTYQKETFKALCTALYSETITACPKVILAYQIVTQDFMLMKTLNAKIATVAIRYGA